MKKRARMGSESTKALSVGLSTGYLLFKKIQEKLIKMKVTANAKVQFI